MKQKDKLQKAKSMVGTVVAYVIDDLDFKVTILDVKSFVGRIQYQIKPVGGKGTAWVEKFKRKNRWK